MNNHGDHDGDYGNCDKMVMIQSYNRLPYIRRIAAMSSSYNFVLVFFIASLMTDLVAFECLRPIA